MITEIAARLWAMSLQAGILILVVLAVRFCLSRYPRIYSYCLWILVGIKLLCPVWIESPFSLQPDFFTSGENNAQEEPEEYIPSADTQSLSPIPQAQDFSADIAPVLPAEGQPDAPESKASVKESAAGSPISVKTGIQKMQIYMFLCIVYYIGAAALTLFYLFQYLHIRIRLSSAVREKGNVWLSDAIASPFVMGVICPKIYLPYHMNKQNKKHILRHERMHIRHCDPLIRIIGTLCLCLHWWNPLVWVGVYFMNQDMEMFCDECVLRHAPLEERKAYAQTLLSFARKNAGIGIGLAFARKSHTEKRVRNILKKRKRSLWVICLLIVLTLFCMIALLTVPKTAESTVAPEINESLSVSLSAEDISYLQKSCQNMPDFSTEEEMDAAFWKDYLFGIYTSDFDREEVTQFSEQYGFDIPYIKVSYEEVNESILQLFGKQLPEYGITPETLIQGESNILYKDDAFLIAASDSPSYGFIEENITQTDILTEVSFTKTIEDGIRISQVTLYLLPADNARGFVLNGKREIPVQMEAETETDTARMTKDSCEVEMNPYGMVTFAVYAPDLSVSPYADATYKLLQNGEEIYSFPLKGTGVREDESVFSGIAALAFPDLNGDGYTDVVTIAHYEHAGEPVPSQARIFTYHAGGYFLEETYLEDAFNSSHETKTLEEIQAFITQPENQDYFVHTSIYGNWRITGYRSPGVYALSQEEIDSYVGSRLEYDIETMKRSTEESSYVITQYEKSVITADELAASFSISRDSLDLPAAELISYQLATESDSLFGCFFYLVDAEHAYIYYDGVFFEAVRD